MHPLGTADHAEENLCGNPREPERATPDLVKMDDQDQDEIRGLPHPVESHPSKGEFSKLLQILI